MTDPSQLSDDQLLAALGMSGPPSAPARPQAQKPAAPQYSGPLPSRAEEVFPSLIQQESGGRAGVVGPDTQWGNAIGRTQMLPATAREVAQKIGVPYREDLLRGTSPEAAQYQDRLGLAYLQEGFERTGNARDALHYYHGGPDRKLWGPKTRAYADSVLALTARGQGIDPQLGEEVQFTSAPMPDVSALPDDQLLAALGDVANATSQGPSDWETLSPEARMALGRGDQVRLPSGEVVTLSGSPFVDMNRRDSDRSGGEGIYLREPNAQDTALAAGTAFSEQIPFGDELVAAGAGVISGRGYDAIREQQMLDRELFNETNRGARVGGGLAGFGVGLAAPGGALINRGGGLLGRSARAAGVGSGYGALYGAGEADGGLADRAQGAAVGGVVGGLTGGATPALGQVASAASNFVTRPLGRAANFVTGGNVPAFQRFSPERQAQTRIGEALRNDGVGPTEIRAAIDEFQSTGVTPSLIDAIQRAAPGGEAARLVRGAAMQQGPASVAAERYLERVGGNVQDNAIGLTRQLTPDLRTADDLTNALTGQRSAAATTDYAGPYAARMTPSPEVLRALEGDPGVAAMRRARTAAVARQDADQIADIDALMGTVRAVDSNPALSGRIPAPEVSGATLDRIQRAMGGRARKMEMSPDTRDIASGLYGRQSSLNDFLDTVPGLNEARGNYRNLTRQIEAVETGGTGLNAAPDTFTFDDLTRPAAAVGYRSALERALGAGADTSTGTMNRVATSANQTRNLREVFGEGSERYQSGLVNLMDQLKNARFLASSSGSQTAPRLADQALAGIASLPTSIKAGFIGLIEKAARGATLTRAERTAIVELGVSEAELREIAQSPFLSGYLTAPVSAQAGRMMAQ